MIGRAAITLGASSAADSGLVGRVSWWRRDTPTLPTCCAPRSGTSGQQGQSTDEADLLRPSAIDQPSPAASRASGVQVVVGVDPGDAIEVVADPVADLYRIVAVVALALVTGGRRDVLTDLCTGAGVVADAVVAPIARQVGDEAHVILAAGYHTAGIPALGEVNQPRADPRSKTSPARLVIGC